MQLRPHYSAAISFIFPVLFTKVQVDCNALFQIKIWFQNRRTKWKREYLSDWELWSHQSYYAMHGVLAGQAAGSATGHSRSIPASISAPPHPHVSLPHHFHQSQHHNLSLLSQHLGKSSFWILFSAKIHIPTPQNCKFAELAELQLTAQLSSAFSEGHTAQLTFFKIGWLKNSL